MTQSCPPLGGGFSPRASRIQQQWSSDTPATGCSALCPLCLGASGPVVAEASPVLCFEPHRTKTPFPVPPGLAGNGAGRRGATYTMRGLKESWPGGVSSGAARSQATPQRLTQELACPAVSSPQEWQVHRLCGQGLPWLAGLRGLLHPLPCLGALPVGDLSHLLWVTEPPLCCPCCFSPVLGAALV